MELRQLRYFVAAAEELHFGRAARRVHISQPPLSQQIQALERELGVDLFERVGRGVRLTRAGVEFLDHARGLLRQTVHAVESAQRAARGEIGELVIGYMAPVALTYVPATLRVFVQRFPDIKLVLHELSNVELREWLQDGRLQIGIVRPPVSHRDIETEVILRERFVLALPAEHPLAALESVPVSAVRGEPLIMLPREIGLRYYAQVLGMCNRAGFTPNVVQELRQLLPSIGIISAGIGLAFLPESMQLHRTPGVAFRPLRDSNEEAETAIAWRRDAPPPAVDRFRDVAREVFGQGFARLSGVWAGGPVRD